MAHADVVVWPLMSRDTSFYYSFLVLPPQKRSAILAVWDFCRAVDDAVDEVVPEHEWAGGLTPEARASATSQLAEWRSELDAAYRGTPKTSQGVALQPYIREFDLPRVRFEELIDGVQMDLAQVRYETFAALSEYCRRVASAVGLICVEIFGYKDPGARAYAESLGMALQLTNIVRDVATDLRRGRIYLPVEDLKRFAVTEDDLRQGQVTPAVAALLQFECERAHECYCRAAAQLPAGDARSLVAAEIMGGIYYAILQRIEAAGYDVFSSRIRVPRPQRAFIALRIWLRALLGMQNAEFRIQTKR
ncbi:MAG TPA: presqualene diphosphate synthase HpnD [Vicinamibacterales bacterium]|nr:presqualene diphosphate synthase HpnD [Vicinamibacterales bacterium]